MTSVSQRKARLISQYEQGRMSAEDFDDRLFEIEKSPQGEAVCGECGGTMRFHEHICGWKCVGCGDVQPTNRVAKIVQYPEGW